MFGKDSIAVTLYLPFAFMLFVLVILAFRATGNNRFWINLNLAFLGNLFAYFGVKYSYDFDAMLSDLGYWADQLENGHVYFTGYLIILLLFGIRNTRNKYFKSHVKRSQINFDQDGDLFKERQFDLNRMKNFIENKNGDTYILGINSAWGIGKSFLIDYFCNEPETRESYFVIKIEVLSYKYNEFDRVLIAKLDQLLRENHIFSMRAAGLRDTLLGINLGGLIYRYFEGVDSEETTTFEDIKEKAKFLPKPVLVIFEDLERADKPKAVKKIFAITERLASEKIRFIYEYDARILDKQKIDYEYREKYIPQEMNLSEISFGSLVDLLVNSYDYPNLTENIVEIIKKVYGFSDKGPFLKYITEVQWIPAWGSFTTRKVRNFLNETNCQPGIGREKDSERLRAIIGFLFIKNFLRPAYDEIKKDESLEDTFPFHIKVDKNEKNQNSLPQGKDILSLSELNEKVNKEFPTDADKKKYLAALFKDDFNRRNYSVFCILGFEPLPAKQLDVKTELELKQRREKVQRAVWNLFENANSELTNNEASVRKLINDVLSAKNCDMQKAYDSYLEELKHGSPYKDNTSIVKSGYHSLVSLALGLSLYHASAEEWKRFFTLCTYVFNRFSDDVYDLIEMMNQVDVSEDQEILLEAIRYFNGLHLSKNLNDYDNYHRFLGKYISAIGKWKFVNTKWVETDMSIGPFVDIKNKKYSDLKDAHFLSHLEQNLEEIKRERSIESPFNDNRLWNEDLLVIYNFLKRNLDLVQKSEKYVHIVEPEGLTSKKELLKSDNPEVRQILGMLDEDCDVKKYAAAVNEAYNTHKINSCERSEIIDEFHQRKHIPNEYVRSVLNAIRDSHIVDRSSRFNDRRITTKWSKNRKAQASARVRIVSILHQK